MVNKNLVEEDLYYILAGIGDHREVNFIVDSVLDELTENIEDTADPENFNQDDVRMAFRRVLELRLGVCNN